MIEKEFINSIKKVTQSRKSQGKNKRTVSKKFWRYLQKQKFIPIGQPITEKQSGLIIKLCNKGLAERLLTHMIVKFPYMGKLILKMFKKEVTIGEDGKVQSKRAVDWNRTLKLWAEDKEAYDERFLVKEENLYVYNIQYSKNGCTFKNHKYLKFKPNRTLKKLLINRIRNKEIDAYLYEIH